MVRDSRRGAGQFPQRLHPQVGRGAEAIGDASPVALPQLRPRDPLVREHPDPVVAVPARPLLRMRHADLADVSHDRGRDRAAVGRIDRPARPGASGDRARRRGDAAPGDRRQRCPGLHHSARVLPGRHRDRARLRGVAGAGRTGGRGAGRALRRRTRAPRRRADGAGARPGGDGRRRLRAHGDGRRLLRMGVGLAGDGARRVHRHRAPFRGQSAARPGGAAGGRGSAAATVALGQAGAASGRWAAAGRRVGRRRARRHGRRDAARHLLRHARRGRGLLCVLPPAEKRVAHVGWCRCGGCSAPAPGSRSAAGTGSRSSWASRSAAARSPWRHGGRSRPRRTRPRS